MNFVIVANAWSAWRDNPTSKHQIAAELVRQGHKVLWVEGAGMRRPKLGAGRDWSRGGTKLLRATQGVQPVDTKGWSPSDGADGLGTMWVLAPVLVPLPAVGWIRALNGRSCRSLILKWTKRLGLGDTPTLINYVPILAECMRGWPGRKVYHCVDRWDAFGMYDRALMAKVNEECCRFADVVIASSSDLYESCARFNSRVYLVLHGVDHGHFSQALSLRAEGRPAELPEGKIVGFFGLLSEWIDQELLVRLSREIPEAQIVLIGSADISIDMLRDEKNIHVFGPRPFAGIPRYAAWFDVAIIPFKVNDLTRAVNPIKLREMMAAGCPVVSTELPEVARYARDGKGREGFVVCARNADEFVEQVRKRLQTPASEKTRKAISESVCDETWEKKVEEILGYMKK